MEDLLKTKKLFFLPHLLCLNLKILILTRWVEVNSPDEGSETMKIGLWL